MSFLIKEQNSYVQLIVKYCSQRTQSYSRRQFYHKKIRFYAEALFRQIPRFFFIHGQPFSMRNMYHVPKIFSRVMGFICSIAYSLRSLPFVEHPASWRRFPGSRLFFLSSIRKNVHAAAYIRPRSGIYTSLNARCRCPAWQLKAFLAAKNDLPGMDQRPPTWMPIYGQASQPSIYLGGEKRGNGPHYDRRKDRGRRLDDNNVYEDRRKMSLGQ